MQGEFSDAHAGFWRGREPDQTANIHWIMERAGDSSKASTSASLTMKKPLTGRIIKILWKVPDHFTCLLRNVYEDQETMVRTEHATTDRSRLENEYIKFAKAVYSHSASLTYMQRTS